MAGRRVAVVVADFEAWRVRAREMLAEGVGPEEVEWVDGAEGQGVLPGLHEDGEREEAGRGEAWRGRVPRAFVSLAERAACHRDPERFAVMYRVLWRLTVGGERRLMSDAADADVHRLMMMERAVRRSAHKMKAFVRFRRVGGEEGAGRVGVTGMGGHEHYVAWFRPEHRVLRLVAPFFARRFAVMDWTILTPDGSAVWDGRELRFGPPAGRGDAPAGDEFEALWRTYYANVFNPARANERAMMKEMPARYWANLPEAAEIDRLLREATGKVEGMMGRRVSLSVTAADFFPEEKAPSIERMREAAAGCRGCELYKRGTQTVFGEGPPDAEVVFVGEQPGDQEDVQGRPFVGPAGKVFDEALAEAGIDRSRVYVTNAVKHFKWEPRGKRRLHAKPGVTEVRACRPWLEGEIGAIGPRVVVCLGATAAQSLLGAGFRVTRDRGKVITTAAFAPAVVATIHPSAVLRMPDEAARAAAYAGLVEDLRVAARAMEG